MKKLASRKPIVTTKPSAPVRKVVSKPKPVMRPPVPKPPVALKAKPLAQPVVKATVPPPVPVAAPVPRPLAPLPPTPTPKPPATPQPPSAPPLPPPAPDRSEDILKLQRQTLDEVRAVRAALPPRPTPPASADEALDGAALSMRRLLAELSEQRIEAVLSRIVALRSSVEGLDTPHTAAVLQGFDRLLEDLGALRFVANPLDHVDPLIHTVVEERARADAPNGVVAETLRPGFRSPRGIVLAKARVAVNRRA